MEINLLALRVVGWGCFGVAAVLIIMIFSDENPFFVAPAIAVSVGGTLVFAISKIIELLTDIRDRLQPAISDPKVEAIEPAYSGAVRSIHDIEVDLNRLKKA